MDGPSAGVALVSCGIALFSLAATIALPALAVIALTVVSLWLLVTGGLVAFGYEA